MHLNFILIAIFISALWGATPIVIKSLTKKFDISTIMFFEGCLYFFFLLCYAYKYKGVIEKDVIKINHVDLFKMFFASVIGGLIGNILYIYVLEKHDSYVTTALVSVSPFFTLILAYYFTKENITLYGVLGVILIVFGILLIAYNETSQPFSLLNHEWMREPLIPMNHIFL